MPHDLTDFIVAQLEAKGLEVFGANSSSDNIATYCFRGHDDETPSLSVHKGTGMFWCFGCGVKGKDWNVLAEHLNADKLADEALPDPFPFFSKKISDKLAKDLVEMNLPWGIEPWVGLYRRVGQYTLDALTAYKWYDDPLRCNRILLPVYMYGDLEGWVSRRLDKPREGIPFKKKYLNAPGIKSKDLLYPFDLVVKMNTNVVVLVEGPFDAIRLVNYDIPALAILGTNNYHKDNRAHLINAGVEHVILAMDSDKSGKKARKVIGPSLAEMFSVEDFFCPHETDPGDMPESFLRKLWHRTR